MALITRLKYKLDPAGNLGPYRIFNVEILRLMGVLERKHCDVA